MLRRVQPRLRRRKCLSHNCGRPARTAIVSNSPSPYSRPRSWMLMLDAALPVTRSISCPLSQGQQQTTRLGARLFQFALRDGIGDDTGAGTQRDVSAGQHKTADQDIKIHAAVPVDIADRAGIGPARSLFQFTDDLHATHLGAAGDGAARKYRAQYLSGRHPAAQSSAYIRNDVMHMRIAFNPHEFIDLDAAWDADAAQIIAFEIDQHDMFGALLGVRQ